MTDTDASDIDLLLVTDDLRVQEELRYALPAGVSARFAADARSAWKELQTVIPSVVVVDIQTGSAGGYGLTKDMGARPEFAQVPVVMLLERAHDSWLAKQAGAVSFVCKPVAATSLVRQCIEAATSLSPSR
ncbi:MAG TPA: response regulator [Actinomycetota bacterium]|nr:response regulator [Actinomycetota bacterium]